jgi:hypothetical protein
LDRAFFIFSGFLELFLLTLYSQGKSLSRLIVGSLAIALACLDWLYIGIALVATGILFIAFISDQKVSSKNH